MADGFVPCVDSLRPYTEPETAVVQVEDGPGQKAAGEEGRADATPSAEVQNRPTSPTTTASAESTLTVSSHTANNTILICIVLYFMHIALDDYRDTGRVSILHWHFLERSFSVATLQNVSTLWLLCNVSLVFINWGFRIWRFCRKNLPKSSPLLPLWDRGWVCVAVLLHAHWLVLPAWAVYRLDLPASAACALSYEQVRLLMKSISYLREHVRETLTLCPTNDSLGHLVYFLFAPTLIYKDSYERTPRVRPLAVARHLVVFLLLVFTMVVVAGRDSLRPFCEVDQPLLDLFGLQGAARFLFHFLIILFRVAPAGVVLTLGSSSALHAWNKMFAELLRFKERDFMQAWWNAPSYDLFFRDWNQFVKAWLVKYVYKELRALGVSRMGSVMATVALSAFWHEYILDVSLGYILPFCALGYFASAAFVFFDPLRLQQQRTRGNLFVLFTLSCGVAAYLSFYFIESTARLQCPQTLDLPWDLFVPRSWTCPQPFNNCSFM